MLDSESQKRKSVNKTDINIPVSWREYSHIKRVFYVALSVLSVGIFYSICVVYPVLRIWMISSPSTAEKADVAIVTIGNKKKTMDVSHFDVANDHIVSLEIVGKRYWTSASQNWQLTGVPDVPKHFSQFLKRSGEQDFTVARTLIQAQYGRNAMELPPVSFWDILAGIIFHPFYLFQYFAVAVWIAEDYIEYSVVILVITFGAVYLTTSETMFNLSSLHELAGRSQMVCVLDGHNQVQEVSDKDLVPGDRLLISDASVVPCDAVLVSGRVSVDESMLTGESVPVNKTPIDYAAVFEGLGERVDDAEEITKRAGHVLFSGTHVLLAINNSPPAALSALTALASTNPIAAPPVSSHVPCVAVVFRTGFRSAKGQLVAALLNPKDKFLTFFADTLWVILLMTLVSSGLYVWSAFYLKANGVPWSEISLYYMDTLTFAIPPALTACLTVATGISIERLVKKNVFVSESNRVNWAGIVSVACFDKTGTLTEERLHFKGVVVPPSGMDHDETECKQSDAVASTITDEAAVANPLVSSATIVFPDTPSTSCRELLVESCSIAEMPTECIELMGTCHGLAVINDSPEGDSLELELFRASEFALSLGSEGSLIATRTPHGTASSHACPLVQYEIMRHFEFTSDKMRSGSVVRRPDGSLVYFAKGSPEAILSLVSKDTVPADIDTNLTSLSKRGLRVLAFAYKICLPAGGSDSEELLRLHVASPQSQLEQGMEFLGLVFLSNSLKKDTVSTIATLQEADMRVNMITGDHIFTAIAIARDCGLVRDFNVFVIDCQDDGILNVTHYETGDLVSVDVLSFLQQHEDVLEAQIAITGRGLELFQRLHADRVGALLGCVRVFARMKPSDKKYIVEQLQRRLIAPATAADASSEDGVVAEAVYEQRHVLFCGDGE
jgi:cation-transporting P-type ATPase 13A2